MSGTRLVLESGRMIELPEGWDAAALGSRFTTRVALAFPGDEEVMRRAEAGDPSVARDFVDRALNHDPGPNELGGRTVVDGSFGRGAAGWCAVAEWAFDALGQEALGAAALAAAHWLRRHLRRLRADRQRVLVSRGAAILLAALHVLDQTDETELPSVEAAEDPVTMAGKTPHELGYAGVEPWLVSLLSADLKRRYVVAITPAGEALGLMRMPITDHERVYSRSSPDLGNPIPPTSARPWRRLQARIWRWLTVGRP